MSHAAPSTEAPTDSFKVILVRFVHDLPREQRIMYVCVIYDMIAWHAQFSAAIVHWSTMTAWYVFLCGKHWSGQRYDCAV